MKTASTYAIHINFSLITQTRYMGLIQFSNCSLYLGLSFRSSYSSLSHVLSVENA